jgi:glutathione S-transferase
MSSDTSKLYEAASSPNSRRVRIFLAEKGISVPRVPVDLAAKEQFSEAYVRINPRNVVPTLVLEDGTAIGEVPAILRYLEETHPDPPLLGVSAKDKALVTMWERRMELEGFAVVMETVRNAAAGLKGRAIAGPHDYEQFRRWLSAVGADWGTSTPTLKPGSPLRLSSPVTVSAWPISPPSSPSTSRRRP